MSVGQAIALRQRKLIPCSAPASGIPPLQAAAPTADTSRWIRPAEGWADIPEAGHTAEFCLIPGAQEAYSHPKAENSAAQVRAPVHLGVRRGGGVPATHHDHGSGNLFQPAHG